MYYIGLDIGGTKCAASLGKCENGLLEVLQKDIFPTAGKTPAQVLERFSTFIEKCRNEKEIQGIGISCGGPLDSVRGVIMAPPSLPLWDDVHIVEYFEKRFGIPTRLQNDANACAIAEWKFGAGVGCRNMVFLTFGTGLGAGLILNGKLYSGANDNAGEIGHVRLTKGGPLGYHKAGSCEGYCSGSGLARLAVILGKRANFKESYREFTDTFGKEEISAKTLAEGAKNGNKFCQAVYQKSGEMLGKTLSILADVINPERIVIGGVFMRSSDLLLPHALKVMKKECLPFALDVLKVLPAGLSENVGDIAALSVAIGEF